MKTLTMIFALVAFALSGTAFAEGISAEDIECGNNPTCFHNPADKDTETVS
ncbi:hypothetical protein [Marinobacter sp.]|uniref:hypothetical protein n=1 Tax=Marinobacter sp. TaxID=50741 RepID=UPI003A946479